MKKMERLGGELGTHVGHQAGDHSSGEAAL